MYPLPPPQQDRSQYQAKLIVNMVVAVFLIVGLMLVLQYFNFIYLREVPVMGNWLMDIYERVFGVPHILVLHGDDSIGDWTVAPKEMANRMLFFSEDIDVRKFSSGMGAKLKQYGLVIVEDVKTLDKDKLINLDDYVKGGGNLIWVGDAGTRGSVQYNGVTIANQTGWTRDILCMDEITYAACDCEDVKANSTCKFLPDEAEQTRVDFSATLGVDFVKNEVVTNPQVEVVDRAHWSVVGITRTFNLENVSRISSVTNTYDSALVANINFLDKSYPGVIVNDLPGSSGTVVYFAYPPEETPEILLPLVERMRY